MDHVVFFVEIVVSDKQALVNTEAAQLGLARNQRVPRLIPPNQTIPISDLLG
ncbi:hypothetical protein [Vibrio sp. WXL210]|uniref:hypothetical protein n=1 Tax=Vibrio sp. WXL210 TaxID=3450709 RepID=UPI003EC66657